MTTPVCEVGAETILARDDLLRLRGQLGFRQLRRVRLHGQTVKGGGPERVELLVALPAARRTGVACNRSCPVGLSIAHDGEKHHEQETEGLNKSQQS